MRAAKARGDVAVNIPAFPQSRSQFTKEGAVWQAMTGDATGDRPTIPLYPEIPRLTDKVYPCHEVVHMDYFLPGCPPSGDAVFAVFAVVFRNKMREGNVTYALSNSFGFGGTNASLIFSRYTG